MSDHAMSADNDLRDAITKTIKLWQETWPHPPSAQELADAIVGLIERRKADAPE